MGWGFPGAQGTRRSLLLTSRARVRVLAVALVGVVFPAPSQLLLFGRGCVVPALGRYEGQRRLQAFSVALLSPPLAKVF